MMLGPLPKATYNRGFVQLEKGDLVVAYTDGVVETRPATAHSDASGEDGAKPQKGADAYEEEYGLDRLIATSRALQSEGAEAIVAGVFADLKSYSGGAAAADDRTLAAVKFTG